MLRKMLFVASVALWLIPISLVAQEQSFERNCDLSDDFDLERLARIDTALENAVRLGKLPHCVTFVAHKGRVVHNKAYGWRNMQDSVQCEPTDIFRIASQTKAICVVGFMTLVEEGKVTLDEQVKKYIPEFANAKVIATYDKKTGKYTTRKAKRELTIYDLVTHTSGIAYDGAYSDICKAKNVCQHLSVDSITLAQNVAKMAAVPLAHDPGAAFSYGSGIEVLGRICEIISGKDIYTFLKERVLDPLGMDETYFYLPDDKVSRLVGLYSFVRGKGLVLSDKTVLQTFPYSGAKTYCSTGAGLCGTIEDYAKFCQMVLNGGSFNGHRILGRKTLEWMQKNSVGDMRGEIGFGMAWDVFRPQNAHNTIISEGSMRWGGMFGTDYVIDPQEQLIILIYTNCMPNASGLNYKTMMHNLVYQALK